MAITNMIQFFDPDQNGTIKFNDFKVLINLLNISD